MDNDIVLLEKAIKILLNYITGRGIAYQDIFREIGLKNEEYHAIFEKMSEIMSREDLIVPEEVSVNKLQVRRLLGRWNPKAHSLSIDTVVGDIIDKVRNHNIGETLYWTEQKVGSGRLRFEYKLQVRENDCRFYDYYNRKIYVLKGGEKDAKDSSSR